MDIAAYLKSHEARPRLRFITCGSVDDGKSTLIGRLLYESKNLFDDQLSLLASDSRRHGTQGEAIDYALLLDGLDAEREQGITIDVAYRYFSTDVRSFIVADCPGHEQYTRNMATGASTADLAVVLVDARKGLLAQTRRHSYIAALFGIRHVVLAVNKMDLVAYSQPVFDAIAAAYRELATALGIAEVTAIPLSGLVGDNVVARSPAMPWHRGPSLLEHLNTVDLTCGSGFSRDASAAGEQMSRLKPLLQQPRLEPLLPEPRREPIPQELAFRMAVQWVCRPSQDFRGFTGQVAAGRVAVGDEVVVAGSGQRSRVSGLWLGSEVIALARAGQSILITLEDEVDISRGDVLAAASAPPPSSDQFAAHLLWMADEALLPGRHYWLKIGARTVSAQITEIKYKADINTQEHIAAKRLLLNEVAACNISLDQEIAYEAYSASASLGAFILIDRLSLATVACGTLDFALRRAANVRWQVLEVDQQARAALKAQTPRCLWFTGLSGSGKSTIANLVEKKLVASGHHTYLLDGDNVRHGLSRDLGFSDEDRVENVRRVAEVARLMVDAGLIVLVSFISPFRDERRMARELFAPGEFVEIFVDTPLEVCEQRDVKGLYAKARAGQIPNFTGISSPYERPQAAELVLATVRSPTAELADEVVAAALAHAP